MIRRADSADQKGFGLVGIIIVVLVLAIVLGVFKLTRDKSGTHLGISNGCKDTDLHVQVAAVHDLKSPLTLQATLTMGAQPVANERVTFRIVGNDNHGRALQVVEGEATTNASGMAVLQKPAGLSDQTITFGKGGILKGYEAEFDGNSATDRVKDKTVPFYCGSKGAANFSAPLIVEKVEI